MEILKAQNVTKIYNEGTELACVALDHVTFSISEGDFICVMGPSGSGKTTLMQNLSTIDTPTRGSVTMFDESIIRMHETDIARYRNSYFGYIFQNLNLIESLTIFENVALPLLINKDRKNDFEDAVSTTLEKFGIADCAEKYPSQCSGGQKQRAAIARALVKEPKLIVADEPTGNLDSKNSNALMRVLEDLNNNNNVSVLIVTHDPLVASYSKKLLYLKDGKIKHEINREEMTRAQYMHKITELNLAESLSE